MPNPFSGLIMKFALALGAGALFAFGLGYHQSQRNAYFKMVDTRAYDRGVDVMALRYEQSARELRSQLEKRASEREVEINNRRQDAENRANAADLRANEALKELVNHDKDFAQCEAQRLPNSVRKHFPGGMLREAIASDNSNR